MTTAQDNEQGLSGFIPLIIFLAVTWTLLWMLLTGTGPEWLRLIIFFGLIATVLIIAVKGWRDHLKDMSSE